MPTKNSSIDTLYVMDSDGNCTEFKGLKSVTVIDDVPDPFDYDYPDSFSGPEVNPTISVTFEVRWNPTVDGMYLLIHGHFPSNNWKKMHGYPMKRKGKGRKK